MSNNPFADNPYQSPAIVPAHSVALDGGLATADVDKLRKFRQQMHALGGVWIFLGSVALGLGIFLAVYTPIRDASDPFLMGILLVSGILHLVLGVMTCCKQMWAVYVGIVLSYISVIGNLISLNLCALAILAAILVQAHRVAGWANDFKRRGIPLTTKT